MELKLTALHRHPANRKIDRKGEKFRQLVESVRAHGVLQDLLVRPRAAGGYEIIGGERRWLAGEEVGLEVVPCKVAELSDREALEILVIENLERDDLDQVEEAEAVRALIDQVGMSPGEVAARLARSLEWVTTRQGLLDLPEEAIAAVKRPKDDERHLHLGTVQLILQLAIEDRPRAVQMILHPELQVGTLRPQQAADVIKRVIVEPKRAKMEWEAKREKLVKSWRTSLGKLLSKDEKRDLVVRAWTWEEAQAPHQGRDAEEALPIAELTAEAPAGLCWVHLAVRHGLAVFVVPADNEAGSRAMVDSRVLRAAEAAWSEPQKRKVGEENGVPIWETVPVPAGREPWLVSRSGSNKVTVTPAPATAAAPSASPAAPLGAPDDTTPLSRAQAAVDGEPEHPDATDDAIEAAKPVVVATVATVQPWTIDGGPVTALRMWAARQVELEEQGASSEELPSWAPKWADEFDEQTTVEICQWIEGLKR